jgi:hypothetical protein
MIYPGYQIRGLPVSIEKNFQKSFTARFTEQKSTLSNEKYMGKYYKKNGSVFKQLKSSYKSRFILSRVYCIWIENFFIYKKST